MQLSVTVSLTLHFHLKATKSGSVAWDETLFAVPKDLLIFLLEIIHLAVPRAFSYTIFFSFSDIRFSGA